MAAWNHSNKTGWNDEEYTAYRKYVAGKVESFRGRNEDCADLSMLLLIEFAAERGLAVTFEDNGGSRYVSKAQATIVQFGSMQAQVDEKQWSTPAEFTKVVHRKIGVEALWKHNTVINQHGPQPGDLMIIYGIQINREAGLGGMTVRHHASLVYRVYPPATPHPKWNDKNVPNFPGSGKAEKQVNVTEYFRGTVDEKTGATVNRHEVDWKDTHFDFLNSRSSAKRNAELIYWANARQLREEGFQFREYGPSVLDNWSDWDGRGVPPR